MADLQGVLARRVPSFRAIGDPSDSSPGRGSPKPIPCTAPWGEARCSCNASLEGRIAPRVRKVDGSSAGMG